MFSDAFYVKRAAAVEAKVRNRMVLVSSCRQKVEICLRRCLTSDGRTRAKHRKPKTSLVEENSENSVIFVYRMAR